MMVVSLKGQLIYLAVYIVVHISVSRNFHILSLGKVNSDSDVHVCVSFVAGIMG